eukprot:scaffold5636_cov159-Ochromonas_danica.AAC.22
MNRSSFFASVRLFGERKDVSKEIEVLLHCEQPVQRLLLRTPAKITPSNLTLPREPLIRRAHESGFACAVPSQHNCDALIKQIGRDLVEYNRRRARRYTGGGGVIGLGQASQRDSDWSQVGAQLLPQYLQILLLAAPPRCDKVQEKIVEYDTHKLPSDIRPEWQTSSCSPEPFSPQSVHTQGVRSPDLQIKPPAHPLSPGYEAQKQSWGAKRTNDAEHALKCHGSRDIVGQGRVEQGRQQEEKCEARNGEHERVSAAGDQSSQCSHRHQTHSAKHKRECRQPRWTVSEHWREEDQISCHSLHQCEEV